jgi:predicted HAD superfamily Cof-like phosphohydrolase
MTVVRDLHDKFDLGNPGVPSRVPAALAGARLGLLNEEYKEVLDEFEILLLHLRIGASIDVILEDYRRLLKELADLRMHIDGAAVTFGLDIEGAFHEVHRSNMSKSPPNVEGGKLVKGPGYVEADMEKFVPPVIEGTCTDG